MTDEVTKPVVVNANQGLFDTIAAALRLLAIIVSTAPAAALIVKKHDLIALYDFFHTQQGIALAGAVTGLVSLGFGLYKSWKRGAQVATVAADERVPVSVASIKQ
jgi:hypothetical protein